MHLKHCKSTIHQQNAHIKEKRGTNGQQVHETGLNNDHQEIMTSNLLYCLLLKRGEIISVGKAAEKKGALCTAGRNVNCCNRYGSRMKVPPKIKSRTSI